MDKQQLEQLVTGIQNDLTEREEEKKLLDEARANKALDGGGGGKPGSGSEAHHGHGEESE